MSAIGSLVFCTDCGSLLDGSGGDEKAVLICDVCGASCKGMALIIVIQFDERLNLNIQTSLREFIEILACSH